MRGDIGGFGTRQPVLVARPRHLQQILFGLARRRRIYEGYLGYKALSVDYDQGVGVDRYEFDVLQQGPVVGITGRF